MKLRLHYSFQKPCCILFVLGVLLVAVVYRNDLCKLQTNVRLSYELWDSPSEPTAQLRVAAWLKENSPTIVAAEHRFGVDRRAIGGVIAYEALENVFYSSYFGLTRSSGPGKVHYKGSYFAEDDPVAKQVEDMGFLPKTTMSERRRLLESPRGAIIYIAAIMSALKTEAHKAGYRLSCEPALLATLYDGWDIPASEQLFRRKRAPNQLFLSAMGKWIKDNLRDLQNAVGGPDISCRD